MLVNQEYRNVNGCPIHIFKDTDDREWQVWWNLDTKFSGQCIGAGATRQEAVQNAVTDLEAITEALQGGPTING